MNALVPIAPAFTMSDIEKVATAIAKGGLFGSKDPYAVLTLCLLAHAEGQHPAIVMRDYHMIQGKPAKKAEAMLRDFIASGGKVEWHQLDDECADATFSHPGGGSARISWDKARVKQAQISNAMHSKFPRQMLRSRTISEGVRTVFPGATSGLYVPEEVQAFDDRPAPMDGGTLEGEAVGSPAPRTKLDGKHTSKTALKNAIHSIRTEVAKAEDNDAIDAIMREAKDTIAQANRDWPELLTGDPNIAEDVGLRGFVEQRREAVSVDGSFKMFLEAMTSNTSAQELAAWVAANEAYVEELSDLERRKFEAELAAFEGGLTLMATAHV